MLGCDMQGTFIANKCVIFVGPTPRAHGPVLNFIDFLEKNNILTTEPILNLEVALYRFH